MFLLLAAGADPCINKLSGKTSAMIALKSGHHDLSLRLERAEEIKRYGGEPIICIDCKNAFNRNDGCVEVRCLEWRCLTCYDACRRVFELNDEDVCC
jgi:hypothetical protein